MYSAILNFQEKSFSISFIFTQNIKNKRKMDKNIFFENIYMKNLKKPKLCGAQFSKNRKPYLTVGPGFFLHNLINQR
jgi:hypothetical protein